MSTLPTTTVLRLVRSGRQLIATMDDPSTRNALTDAMLADFEAVLDATRDDRTLSVLVLRGADGRFCAGGDLKGTMGSGDDEMVREQSRRGGRLYQALDRHPLAVVAVVDGPAMGGGFGLACCADIVITGPRARFALSETSLGLVPAQIAPYVVSRVGLAAARRLALTGLRLDGAGAERIGLSDQHCETSDLVEAALDEVLAAISRCGPQANALTKQLLQDMDNHPDVIDRAADVFTEALTGAEAREGIDAFVSKRAPNWTTSR